MSLPHCPINPWRLAQHSEPSLFQSNVDTLRRLAQLSLPSNVDNSRRLAHPFGAWRNSRYRPTWTPVGALRNPSLVIGSFVFIPGTWLSTVSLRCSRALHFRSGPGELHLLMPHSSLLNLILLQSAGSGHGFDSLQPIRPSPTACSGSAYAILAYSYHHPFYQHSDLMCGTVYP